MWVAQLCPTLWDLIDCNLTGFSVHGILQARILEWVAIPFSRGSSQPRNQTEVSCIAGRFFTNWALMEALVSDIQHCSSVGEGNGTPLQYSCLENLMDGGAWRTTVHGSLRVGHDWVTSLSCIGEGNGNPLQCSCLENPRDRGAWWAAVYGVHDWSDLAAAMY